MSHATVVPGEAPETDSEEEDQPPLEFKPPDVIEFTDGVGGTRRFNRKPPGPARMENSTSKEMSPMFHRLGKFMTEADERS